MSLDEILKKGSKYIDYKMGLIGAGVMGSIVFGINYYDTNDLLGASTAALKQGGYTALFGGIMLRGCEYLAKTIQKQSLAMAAAVIIPSTCSIALTYGVHSMKGTLKPLTSTIPTAVTIFPSTAIWAYRKRKETIDERIESYSKLN